MADSTPTTVIQNIEELTNLFSTRSIISPDDLELYNRLQPSLETALIRLPTDKLHFLNDSINQLKNFDYELVSEVYLSNEFKKQLYHLQIKTILLYISKFDNQSENLQQFLKILQEKIKTSHEAIDTEHVSRIISNQNPVIPQVDKRQQLINRLTPLLNSLVQSPDFIEFSKIIQEEKQQTGGKSKRMHVLRGGQLPDDINRFLTQLNVSDTDKQLFERLYDGLPQTNDGEQLKQKIDSEINKLFLIDGQLNNFKDDGNYTEIITQLYKLQFNIIISLFRKFIPMDFIQKLTQKMSTINSILEDGNDTYIRTIQDTFPVLDEQPSSSAAAAAAAAAGAPIASSLKYKQLGGLKTSDNISTVFNELKNYVSKFISVFNTEQILKLMTIFSLKEDNSNFDSYGITIPDFVKYFFIKITSANKPTILSLGITQEHIDKDSLYVNKNLISSKNEYIGTYIVLHKILHASQVITDNMYNYSFIIIEIFSNTLLNKNFRSIEFDNNNIDIAFNQIVNSKKKVFTYVKLRKDDGLQPNTRYIFTEITPKKIIKLDHQAYDTDTSNIEHETYYFGPFDKFFLHDKKNNDVATSILTDIKQKLIINSEDFCFIGYGQSGSGKTSTLIKFEPPTGTPQDGVLTKILTDQALLKKFNSITLKMKNIYLTHESETNQKWNDFNTNAFAVSSDISLFDIKEFQFVKTITQGKTEWKFKPDFVQREKQKIQSNEQKISEISTKLDGIKTQKNTLLEQIKVLNEQREKLQSEFGQGLQKQIKVLEEEIYKKGTEQISIKYVLSTRDRSLGQVDGNIFNGWIVRTNKYNVQQLTNSNLPESYPVFKNQDLLSFNTEIYKSIDKLKEKYNAFRQLLAQKTELETQLKSTELKQQLNDQIAVLNVQISQHNTQIIELNNQISPLEKQKRLLEWNNKQLDIIDQKEITSIVLMAFELREIEPTPNNRESSRSHVIVDLHLKTTDTDAGQHIIVCDLAGVENKFNCENIEELKKFITKYSESNKYRDRQIEFDRLMCDDSSKTKPKKLLQEYNSGVELINQYNANYLLFNDIYSISDKVTTNRSQEGGSSCVASSNLMWNCNKGFKYDNIHQFNNEIFIQKIGSYHEFLNTKLKLIENFNNKIEKVGAQINKALITETGINDIIQFYRSNVPESNRDKTKNLINDLLGMVNIWTTSSYNKINYYNVINYDVYDNLFRNFTDATTDLSPIKFILILANVIYEEYKIWMCEYITYLKIKFNCKLRVNEGYLINKTLDEMRVDVKKLILKTTKIDDKLPLFFDKDILPYCRNLSADENNYNLFYPSADEQSDDTTGKIIETFSELGVNKDKLNFVILTVVNINSDTNNPPNPPFININDVYISKVRNSSKSLDLFKNLLKKTLKYNFYKNNVVLKDINTEVNRETITTERLNELIDKAIQEINTNNSATLIGSLASTDVLQNMTFDKIPCFKSSVFEEILPRLTFLQPNNILLGNNKAIVQRVQSTSASASASASPSISSSAPAVEISFTGGGINYKDKYLKYKNKYLSLKSQMK
jgi:hypothetical protein